MQFFLPRVDWKQVGYESLEIQAETFALETPTDHSTVGLGSCVRSIPEEGNILAGEGEGEGWRPGGERDEERQTQRRETCGGERRLRTN